MARLKKNYKRDTSKTDRNLEETTQESRGNDFHTDALLAHVQAAEDGRENERQGPAVNKGIQV